VEKSGDIGIDAYSFIGEKIVKSLEPLLATPTTDEEILAGKTIADFQPANFSGVLIFTVLGDIFSHNTPHYLYYTNWNIIIILFLLAPLACIFSVGYNVMIPSRANDIRTAQQPGPLILLTLGAVYLMTEIRVLDLRTNNLLIMAPVLAAIEEVLFFLVKATFQREEILVK
jgi:ABC-2 type transport system permease protein